MLLSIIIPCYNSGKFISSTLNRLIEQDLTDCEVIIVNDGSSDDTLIQCLNYEKKYNNIKVIDKINEGVAVARNRGIQESIGRYVCFLDSDDAFTDGTLDFYRNILLKYKDNSFFAFGYYTLINNNIGKSYSYSNFNEKTIDSDILKQSFFLKKLCFNICSCIYEKQFLVDNSIKFLEGVKIGEDIEFLLRVLQFSKNCVYHSRNCFIYQIRNDSVMQGYQFIKFDENNFYSYKLRRDVVLEDNFQTKNLSRYANFWLCTQYISHLNMYLKSESKNNCITEEFINDKKLMYRRVSSKNILIYTLINLFRIINIKLLLRLFKKL